ncbi:MAG TPA: hypothetical protein VIN40_00265 [Candidatus Tyrphobacter sp.]
MKLIYVGLGTLIVAAGLAACGGGGGSTGGTPPIRPGGPSPSAAMYTGTETIANVYNGYPPSGGDPNVTPYPNNSVTYSLSDSVSSARGSNLVSSSETVTEPNQKITETLSAVVSPAPNGAVTNITLASAGYTDSDGYSQRITYPAGAGLIIDQSPENNAANWTNSAQDSVAETYSDSTNINRSTNADGTYVETEKNTGQAINDTATTNADGSASWLAAAGSYGFGSGNVTGFTMSAPSGGNITYTLLLYPSGSQVLSVPVWYPTGPIVLASSNSTITTGVTFPGACSVPAAYGTTGNDIHSVTNTVDAVFGFLETTTTDAYTTSSAGAVCVRTVDVLKTLYDYNGDQFYFVYVSNVPLITTTTTTTLTLQSGGGIGVASTARGTESSQASSNNAAAIANAGVVAQILARGEATRLHAAAEKQILMLLRARRNGGRL